jgi:hypothetical protein
VAAKNKAAPTHKAKSSSWEMMRTAPSDGAAIPNEALHDMEET